MGSNRSCKIFSERLFASHDLAVDIIVTPTRIIRVEKRLPKPEGVIWNILTREKFDKIPILKEIQVKMIYWTFCFNGLLCSKFW